MVGKADLACGNASIGVWPDRTRLEISDLRRKKKGASQYADCLQLTFRFAAWHAWQGPRFLVRGIFPLWALCADAMLSVTSATCADEQVRIRVGLQSPCQ